MSLGTSRRWENMPLNPGPGSWSPNPSAPCPLLVEGNKQYLPVWRATEHMLPWPGRKSAGREAQVWTLRRRMVQQRCWCPCARIQSPRYSPSCAHDCSHFGESATTGASKLAPVVAFTSAVIQRTEVQCHGHGGEHPLAWFTPEVSLWQTQSELPYEWKTQGLLAAG